MTPYIGVTGFANANEVATVLEGLPPNPSLLLMCGVLLSNALLSGRPSGAPERCPSPDSIGGIFSNDPRCLNLVHYRPRVGENLANVLAHANEVGGGNCHGVQINATRGVPWPDPEALVEYRRRCSPNRIVLQVGREAMASVNHGPSEVAKQCARYSGIVTDVLVDASEGLGRPLDADASARYLDAIALAAPGLGLVVAGGLCAENLASLLAPLIPGWAHVSIDAEGRLRDDDDRLMPASAAAYVFAAMEMLGDPPLT